MKTHIFRKFASLPVVQNHIKEKVQKTVERVGSTILSLTFCKNKKRCGIEDCVDFLPEEEKERIQKEEKQRKALEQERNNKQEQLVALQKVKSLLTGYKNVFNDNNKGKIKYYTELLVEAIKKADKEEVEHFLSEEGKNDTSQNGDAWLKELLREVNNN